MFPGIDLDSDLQRRRLLQQLPTISPDQIQQDPTAAPSAPVAPPQSTGPTSTQSPNYTPVQTQNPPGNYTPVPDNMKVPQQPISPFQAQINDINKDISGLSQAGQDVTTLKGQPPSPGKVSKLRAALLLPLQILAGAGHVDTTKEFNQLIHPGYGQAMSDYQKKLASAENKYATMKDLIKEKLDALKEEGTISKDEAETLNQKADTAIKQQQLQNVAQDQRLKAQELEVRQAEIPPVGQAIALGRAKALKEGREYTAKDLNEDITNTSEAMEAARRKTEMAKWDAEQAERIAEKKRTEGVTNINADIQKANTEVMANIKPLENAKMSMANLRSLFDKGDTEGFSRLMTTIMEDNALSAATHGSVRQQLGIIQELIKSPGLWNYIQGKIQGVLHPGKGDISDALIKQAHNAFTTVEKTIDDESTYQNQRLADLTMLDPSADGTRKKLAEIETRVPPSIQTKVAPTPTKPPDDKDRAAQIKKIEDQLNAVDAAIKKKLAQNK